MQSKRIFNSATIFAALLACFLVGPSSPLNAQLPAADQRSRNLRDADHFELVAADIRNSEQWQTRKKEIREKLLLTTGLSPMPEKTPLNAKVFGWVQGMGFKVAKVYFESLPGYRATGNLYVPDGSNAAAGKFPAILCPHGHWTYGRLTNSVSGSLPGRYIDFARMGFVVFAIDMVGYNDCFQLPHDHNKSLAQLKADKPVPYEPSRYRGFFDFPEAELYGLNLGGLQLWNNIRALDFLESLDYVDGSRMGVTGASGGATQTITLMTADDRIKVAAPVNIIGAKKHPGCSCENPLGLWVETSTLEMASAFSPRPLILLSATEDPWTNSFPTREFPLIKRYFELDNALDMVKNVHVNAGHNYNADSRAAIYEFFCRHLNPGATPIKDVIPISDELAALGDLRVFPDGTCPDSMPGGMSIVQDWIDNAETAFVASLPDNSPEYGAFRDKMTPLLASILNVEKPQIESIIEENIGSSDFGGFKYELSAIGRKDKSDRVELESLSSAANPQAVILLVYPENMGGFKVEEQKKLNLWAGELAGKGYKVVRVGGYASGALRIDPADWHSFSWPEAYNRPNYINAVQDILTAITWVEKTSPGKKIILASLAGEMAISSLYSSAISGAVTETVLDLGFSAPDNSAEMTRQFPVNGIRKLGDVRTAIILAAQNKVRLLNPARSFNAEFIRGELTKIGLENNFDVETVQAAWPPSRLF